MKISFLDFFFSNQAPSAPIQLHFIIFIHPYVALVHFRVPRVAPQLPIGKRWGTSRTGCMADTGKNGQPFTLEFTPIVNSEPETICFRASTLNVSVLT